MREEIEHACMVLEWLRRNDKDMEEQLKAYLFSQGPITEVEEEHEGRNGASAKGLAGSTSGLPQSGARLTVGSLKGV